MTTADGSIIISTKIDASEINTDTRKISQSFGGIIKTVKSMMVSLAAGIGALVAGIGIAVAAIGKTFFDLARNVLAEFDLMTGSSGEKFQALQATVETLKGAFVNFLVQAILPAIPYLIDFANHLTRILQTATQIVAAFFGFKQTVGGIMSKAASDAKKMTKEVKGALAAFDQINVLQQKQEGPEAPEGPIATPGPITVSDDILNEVARLKKLWDEFLKDPMGALVTALTNGIKILEILWGKFIQWVRDNLPFGDVIADVLTVIGNTFRDMFINFIKTIQNVKENVELIFNGIGEFLKGVFTGDWSLIWQGLVDIVMGVFGVLGSLIEGIANHFLIVFGGMVEILRVLFAPVIEWLAQAFENIKDKIGDAIQSIMTTFGDLAKWFLTNVWSPIEGGFGSMLTGVKQGFEKTFAGIKTLVKGVMNSIIDFINQMIEGVVFGINSVIGAANAVGEIVGAPEIAYVDAPKIPRLASGAVIPPNAEFLAVLGDQKNGKNIEAPAAMFEEMLQRAAQIGGGDITVTMPVYLDGEKIYQNQKRISRQHGTSLIAGGSVR